MEQIIEKSYLDDLEKIKETISENRRKALVVVNSAMIITYYQIGTIINERKTWGNKYVQRLADDLREFGRGYSFDQLRRMARFAQCFSESEIRARPVPKIPWRTIISIMNKSSSKEEMLWYVDKTYENKWSKTDVDNQFKSQAYQRNMIEPITTGIDLNNGIQSDIIKDTLALDFLSKKDLTNEKTLKDKLLDNVVSFLQELGPGFALLGREYKLVTPTNKNYFIDLLMYHVKIHAYVVIEVKIGDFDPGAIGQLNFYVNAIDDLEKSEDDNPTIGILLCKDADNYTATTTLKGIKNQLGITKYKIIEDVSNYLEERLKEII